MKKFSEISQGIQNIKQIEYKFELENDVAKMLGQEISIYLQNMMGYFKFLMGHPRFWYNQIYEPSHIFNESENRVYNKMYTGNWW